MWCSSQANQVHPAMNCSARPGRFAAMGTWRAQRVMTAPIVLLDDAGNRRLRVFSQACTVIRAGRAEEVAPALAALDEALAAGRHAAGYFSYDLGYLLERRLAQLLPQSRPVPLLWFGV